MAAIVWPLSQITLIAAPLIARRLPRAFHSTASSTDPQLLPPRNCDAISREEEKKKQKKKREKKEEIITAATPSDYTAPPPPPIPPSPHTHPPPPYPAPYIQLAEIEEASPEGKQNTTLTMPTVHLPSNEAATSHHALISSRNPKQPV